MLSGIKSIVAILLSVLIAIAPYQQSAFAENEILLPDMGDPTGALITPVQERLLGAAFFRSLHGKLQINQDLEIQYFIESLGERLVVNSEIHNRHFIFLSSSIQPLTLSQVLADISG